MAADPLIYCLEQLTDYDQFERLCHDLMALDGYKNIEPLGSSKDKGRDAIHIDRQRGGLATVFAYSVREDWRVKLEQDAAKVHKHKHPCNQLVFLSTARFTPYERDDAVAFIRNKCGWECELYGLERLRVLLATTHKEVVANHPSIFCPPFFPSAGGLTLSACFDHIIIDDVDNDAPLALWIARRLILAGYKVWCRHLAPLAGSSTADTIKALIRTRAIRYLPVLSAAALKSPDLTARRSAAHVAAESRSTKLVLPVHATPVDAQQLDQETRQLEAAHFESGWAKGLSDLLHALEATRCPKSADGSAPSVLQSFMPANVLTDQSEVLAANIFVVKSVPQVLNRFVSDVPLGDHDILQARQTWAFRKVSPSRFIGFCPPPATLAQQFSLKPAGGTLWSVTQEMDSISVYDIVKELLRRSMDVAVASHGALYCRDRDLFYLPVDVFPRNMLPVVAVDGKLRRVGIAGERTFGSGIRKAKYRYYLAPTFSVIWRGDHYCVILRPRIRISDIKGNLYPARAAVARRKDIGGTWWNDDWLNRVLAVVQHVSENGIIAVGSDSSNTVEVHSQPLTWTVTTGINEIALKDAKRNRDEVAARSDTEEGEPFDESASVSDQLSGRT
jgi:hypothetical protein